MKSSKIKFQVCVGSKVALERAIYYVNLQSHSDYELVSFESHEVGIGIIQVTESKIKPEFLFMLGHRYKLLEGLEPKVELKH